MDQTVDVVRPPHAPSYPQLKRGDWNPKFGRYDFHRFDHLSSAQASVGGASIGKVDVDCKFLFKESKWGLLDGDRPAGIIYLDLDFHQPPDCQLVWASIHITLDESPDGLEQETSHNDEQYPVQMTSFFGPQHMVGPERSQHKAKHLSLKPEFQGFGFGVGGVGPSFETAFTIPHRWKFAGRLVPPDRRGSAYRTLAWELTESDLEPGQSNKVHTAFAFEHGGQPFLMKVKVKGSLKKIHHRLKEHVGKKLNFGPRPADGRDTATTLVGAYHGMRRPLDALARGLEHAMEEKNQRRRPLELPPPQRATFTVEGSGSQGTAPLGYESGSRISSEESTDGEGMPAPLGRIASRPQAQLQAAPETEPFGALQASLISESTAPILEELASAGRYFVRPVREMREDVSEVSRLSSMSTVVEQEQSSSVETSPANGQDNSVVRPVQGKLEVDVEEMQAALSARMWLWMVMAFRLVMDYVAPPSRMRIKECEGCHEAKKTR